MSKPYSGQIFKCSVTVFVLSLFFPNIALSQELNTKVAGNNLYLKMGSGAVYQVHRPYHLIQTQDETVAPFTPGAPIEHNTDTWGPFGEVTLGYSVNENTDIEGTFLGIGSNSKKSFTTQGGSAAGVQPSRTSLLPFIDGQTRLGQQAAEIGGQFNNINATADVDYTYKQHQYEFDIDLDQRFIHKKQYNISGILGVGYAYFYQGAQFNTSGIDFDNNLTTVTSTSEILRDRLGGVRLGVKGERYLTPSISLNGALLGSVYYDMSKFRGSQNFLNASVPRNGTLGSFSLEVNDTDDSFVPRLTTKIGISKNFNSKFNVELCYGFDAWWNMSAVDNPTISVSPAINDVIDHPARIGKQTIIQHFIGAKITW